MATRSTSAPTEQSLDPHRKEALFGSARWRRLPSGAWTYGEWDREMRIITFTWSDESEWRGQYDPVGNAMLFEQTVPDAQPTILRRVFR